MAEDKLAAQLSARRPSRRLAASLLRRLSRASLATFVLLYILAVHLIGLLTFTRGFLLTRLSIPHVAPAYDATSLPPITPTHSKAVVLVIDALRTDFISPHHPTPPSPYHHGILSVPAELTAARSSHSVIFNAYSDPPTSTMQRIKGLTTGSLPTFIDVGNNFASVAIEEDSLVAQAQAAERRVVFMGDDTWVNLFPTSFAEAHPYDSFNVEDLHSVDDGVIEHLFPYLAPENQTRWDVLIGHCLGVDHVGHRVGPERETMRAKLKQMDDVVRRVVELIDDDTLLVVLGDHGMDSKGNHGGDSELEVAAATWIYSKGAPIAHDVAAVAPEVAASLPTYLFPGASASIRHIEQIDLVPSLSLLLGLPIPFNSLGSVIPELFASSLDRLAAATASNAAQVSRYLDAYGDTDVTNGVRALRSAAMPAQSVAAVLEDRLVTSTALSHLRTQWAEFSLPLIGLGLAVLGLSIPALLGLYVGVRNGGPQWDVYARLALDTALTAAVVLGSVAGTVAGAYTREPLAAIKAFLVAGALVSEAVLAAPLVVTRPRLPSLSSLPIQRAIGPALLIIHAISFASNSFIMWEDRVVLFLLSTIPIIHLAQALTAPTATMRLRILGLSAAILVLVRLVGAVTVCREEQQPYCTVTFYAGSLPVAPRWALFSALPLALALLPRAVAITLSLSKSFSGPARVYIGIAWRAVIVLSAAHWTLEYLEQWEGLQPQAVPFARLARLWSARIALGATLGALPYLWATSGLCIEVVRTPDQTGQEKAVEVYGFANAFGSTYVLFLLIPFALVHLVSPPAGQVVLCAQLVVVLLYLESTDTHRDAILMTRSFASSSAAAGPGAFEPGTGDAIVRPKFTDAVPLVLLGHLAFFATGHQAVLSSIQWKAAFVGFETVTLPFAPALVALNTWGPLALAALAIPLLACWNVSPRPQASVPVLAHALQMALAFALCHAVTTFAAAASAAWLRRHLMVWKVFAPRYMLAAVTLVVVDAALVVAVGVGLRMTSWKVWRTFKSTSV
ncbi:mannose-ethanolamine phosphotransferase gpi13 [Cryptotrichosporon argae]